ncbi:unnamed protein product [Musa textilis]
MARWNEKDVVGESSSHENDVESLRLQLRRLLNSIQEKNKIIEELRSRNDQCKNDVQQFTSNYNTPPHSKKSKRFRTRHVVKDEWQNKYNPRLDISEFEGKINIDDFID